MKDIRKSFCNSQCKTKNCVKSTYLMKLLGMEKHACNSVPHSGYQIRALKPARTISGDPTSNSKIKLQVKATRVFLQHPIPRCIKHSHSSPSSQSLIAVCIILSVVLTTCTHTHTCTHIHKQKHYLNKKTYIQRNILNETTRVQ